MFKAKKTICIFASLLFALGMMAQPPKPKDMGGNKSMFSPEAYEKKMEEFITEKAGLTPEEASKFFPLLKEMHQAQRAIDEKSRKMQKPFKEPFKGPSEDECKKMVMDATDLEVQHKKLEQTYYTKKFPTVLSWHKILRVRWAMERFKIEALRHFSPHFEGPRQFPRKNGNAPK